MNVVAVKPAAAIGSLNVTVMFAVRDLPTVPTAGDRELIAGGGPVRNDHVAVGNGLPARSRIAPVPPVNVTV